MSTETLELPAIQIRGRSVMALVVAPEWPLEDWLAALDQQMRTTSGLFGHRPVVANLGAAPDDDAGPRSVIGALDALAARGLKLIGIDGIDPTRLSGTRWARLASFPPGRETILPAREATPKALEALPKGDDAPPPSSMLVDRTVRSGQAIIFEHGDVIVIGSIASGAEVVAGGSIHVYGALRGRAIAGVVTGGDARIFCRKMEAELVAVDGLYRMAEHWGPDLHGRAVQVRRDQKNLALSPLV